MKTGRVKAIVRVVMDVESDSVWGTDTTWNQISRQAEDGVRGLLTNNNPLRLKEMPRLIRSLKIIHTTVYPEGAPPTEERS